MSLIKGTIYKSKSMGKFRVLKQFDSIKFEELTNDDIRRLISLKVLEEYKEFKKYLITIRHNNDLIGASIESLEVDEIERKTKSVHETYSRMLNLPPVFKTLEAFSPMPGSKDLTIIEELDPLTVKIEIIDDIDKYKRG